MRAFIPVPSLAHRAELTEHSRNPTGRGRRCQRPCRAGLRRVRCSDGPTLSRTCLALRSQGGKVHGECVLVSKPERTGGRDTAICRPSVVMRRAGPGGEDSKGNYASSQETRSSQEARCHVAEVMHVKRHVGTPVLEGSCVVVTSRRSRPAHRHVGRRPRGRRGRRAARHGALGRAGPVATPCCRP